jgi:SpoVK/Ycf46/Vps4 family AAA+-type ATPase
MPTSAQLKALFESFAENDDQRFYSAAMQIAAHEARNGHNELGRQLRELIDRAKMRKAHGVSGVFSKSVPIVQPQGELANLLSASYPSTKLPDMVLEKRIEARLRRIISEQRQAEKLYAHGLVPRHRFLLIGPSGTGKTMTASALAGELNLPLFVIRFEAIITKFMGESSAKLAQVFDALKKHRGVYLFDEFDTIGSMRRAINDVGEARRILNTFLQLTDRDDSSSLILAATNHADILDEALFRRFDDVIEFMLPGVMQRQALFKTRLTGFVPGKFPWQKITAKAAELSHGEIVRIIEDVLKNAIIHCQSTVNVDEVQKEIEERKSYHDRILKRNENHLIN